MSKQKDLQFIQGFSKISITSICEKNNICKQNIFSGTASEKNLAKVKEEVQKEFAKLYLQGDDNE
jgi:hypothetical protein